MVLGMATSQNSVSAPIDMHFGRCSWFCVYDTGTGEVGFVENTFTSSNDSAGVQVVEMLEKLGVTVVVAGRFGNRVVDLLKGKGIQLIVVSKEKSVEDIINRTKQSKEL